MLSEIISANFAGTHSKTIANAPASSTAFASSMSFFAPSSLFPLICGQTEAPPSSFTA